MSNLQGMDSEKENKLRIAWKAKPKEPLADPASEEELDRYESTHGPIPQSFRWFLKHYGGGVVGSERVDSIEELLKTHAKFQAEYGPPSWWTMTGVFVIGWDGAGNPFGIEIESGRILVEDHNFGGIHEMFASFDNFIFSDTL